MRIRGVLEKSGKYAADKPWLFSNFFKWLQYATKQSTRQYSTRPSRARQEEFLTRHTGVMKPYQRVIPPFLRNHRDIPCTLFHLTDHGSSVHFVLLQDLHQRLSLCCRQSNE
jgi:hypothetical protein